MTRALYASSDAHQATFVVYINGIEVPAKSASLRFGVWQVPEMTVDMVADPVLVRLGAEDRVQVAVFYLDDTDVSPDVEPQFRLFGEGEITGWGYRNTSRGRTITFTVVNQMAVFSQLFTQFMTSVDSMLGPLTGPASVTTVLNATDQLVYPYSLFIQGLIPGQGQSASTITRPFDFLYNAVRGMIGSQVPENQRAIPAANFFTRWSRLNNFHNRFAATPFFDQDTTNPNVFPVLRALQNTSAIDVISKNLLPNVQNAGSFWDMLQLVFSTMFMEIAMIPGMPLVSVDLSSSLVQTTDFTQHRLASSNGAWVSTIRPEGRKTTPKRIPNYFAKPQMLFSVPPSCNALFPSQIISLAYEENYATQPTRLYFNDETLTRLMKTPQGGLSDTIQNALSTGYPFEADLGNKLQNKFGTFNGKNFLLYPEEYFKGPVMDRRDVPPWLFWLGQSQFATGNPAGKSADGQVPTPAAPPKTSSVTAPTPPAAVGNNVMRTSGRVGQVGAGGQRTFGERVEKLRGSANRAQANTGVPADFLLAWVSQESDGKLEVVTKLNERGYFQIMGPHVENGVAKPLNKVEAGMVLGLTIADVGADANDTTARMSRDSDFAFQQGVRLVQAYRLRVNKIAAQNQLSWPEADLWRMTKLYHNAPAVIPTFISRAAATLGHPPTSWAEMHRVISPGLSSFEANVLQNATATGGVVAGASGSMVTQSDPRPTRAPAAQAAPLTGEASTTKTSPPAAPPTPVIAPASYEDIQRSNLTVYQLYAKYEYFRERYARRSGSATLSWNPYVVPGFPGALFDQRATRVDIVCYITTVQQTMSNEGQRGTVVSFLYGRQFQEMFELMRQEFDGGETVAGSAPAEPVRDVRKIVQSFEQAESFYQRLFYGAQRLYNKDAAFDFRKIIAYAPSSDAQTPEPIFIDGPDEATQDNLVQSTALAETLVKQREVYEAQIPQLQGQIATLKSEINNLQAITQDQIEFIHQDDPAFDPSVSVQQRREQIATLQVQLGSAMTQLASLDLRLNQALAVIQDSQNTTGVTQVRHNLDGSRELVPLPTAAALFSSYDSAMRYNWRPICSLDEYIIFHDAAGEGPISAQGHARSVGARFYDRIRRFTAPGEGFVPPPSVSEASSTLAIDRPVVQGLDNVSFPQTRADWDSVLLAYRQNVLRVKAPRT